MATATYRTLIVTSVRTEAPEVKTIFLQPADTEPFSYKSGQFLTFVFPQINGEARRSYSFSSSPELSEPMAITVKRVPNGRFSRYLIDEAKPGDHIITSGASGFFVLPDNLQAGQVVMLAAGIGITPLFSLIKSILHTRPGITVALIYSTRKQEESIFFNELEMLRNQFPERFSIQYLYSTAKDLTRARLSKTLLPVLLNELLSRGAEPVLFYLCGPFPYMRMAQWAIEEAGYQPEQIKKEQFNTALPVMTAAPPDQQPHEVMMTANGKVYRFRVQYPETILKGARRLGLLLPYSCETGRCGSCAALCTAGKVWHSNNEVLTDAELAKGRILTCTGFPVFGDVQIDLDRK